ncbi:MAG: aldolase/citrate lyase family protein [Sphingomonadaceae bacterium]|nr:aldolase/citrate lyase family protein [Sphingomonadaceae bacterium]
MILHFASLLFSPGAAPARFAKALASGADLVVIDLEDSVPPEAKPDARAAAVAAVAADPRFAVRINPVSSVEGLRDLVALADAKASPRALMVPKAEHASQLDSARAALPEAPLIPLLETPAAIRRTAEIASAADVAAAMFGGGDLSAELGVELAWEPLATARGLFLLGCAEAGVPAIDVPWVRLDDAGGLADECRRAAAAGFGAKAAIHPAQLEAIHAAFRPTPEAIAEARGARAAFADAGGRALRWNGRMLEAPLMRRFERVLAQAEAANA